MSDLLNTVVEVGTFGLVSDVTGSEAAGEAGQAAAAVQSQAALAGIEENRRQFDLTRGDLQPRIEGGNQAFKSQQDLLGQSGQAAQDKAYGNIQESAGQRFLRDRAQRALLRNSAAIGGLGGGNVRTALQEQAVGFAQQDIDNQFNRLGQLSGQGQNATNTSGQFGAQTASNVANLQANQGAAQATGILAPTAASSAATNQLLQLGGTAAGIYANMPKTPGVAA
jgi:hypothetical protein